MQRSRTRYGSKLDYPADARRFAPMKMKDDALLRRMGSVMPAGKEKIMTNDSIKRYTVSGDLAYPIHEDPEGDYVTYEDHVAAIEADRTRQGDAAKVLAELVALIPLADTLNASASCQDLIDYFKGIIADRKRRGEPVDLDRYDAGLLGGQDGMPAYVWHDIIRAELDRAYDFYMDQIDRAAPQPAEPVKITCKKCNGTGVESTRFHGVWPNGEECLEPIKCDQCDGFGTTSAAELVKVPSVELQGLADRAYCQYLEQMRRPECKGVEYKLENRKFGVFELAAHNKAYEHLGRYKAFSEAAALLARYGNQPHEKDK